MMSHGLAPWQFTQNERLVHRAEVKSMKCDTKIGYLRFKNLSGA